MRAASRTALAEGVQELLGVTGAGRDTLGQRLQPDDLVSGAAAGRRGLGGAGEVAGQPGVEEVGADAGGAQQPAAGLVRAEFAAAGQVAVGRAVGRAGPSSGGHQRRTAKPVWVSKKVVPAAGGPVRFGEVARRTSRGPARAGARRGSGGRPAAAGVDGVGPGPGASAAITSASGWRRRSPRPRSRRSAPPRRAGRRAPRRAAPRRAPRDSGADFSSRSAASVRVAGSRTMPRRARSRTPRTPGSPVCRRGQRGAGLDAVQSGGDDRADGEVGVGGGVEGLDLGVAAVRVVGGTGDQAQRRLAVLHSPALVDAGPVGGLQPEVAGG